MCDGESDGDEVEGRASIGCDDEGMFVAWDVWMLFGARGEDRTDGLASAETGAGTGAGIGAGVCARRPRGSMGNGKRVVGTRRSLHHSPGLRRRRTERRAAIRGQGRTRRGQRVRSSGGTGRLKCSGRGRRTVMLHSTWGRLLDGTMGGTVYNRDRHLRFK